MITMGTTASLEMMLGLDQVIEDKGTILHILKFNQLNFLMNYIESKRERHQDNSKIVGLNNKIMLIQIY